MTRRVQREAAIVEAALRLIRDEGTDGLTMARLAREMGYSHARAYYYFKTREALLTRLQLRGITKLGQHMDARLADVTDPLQRARVAASCWTSFRRAEPDLARVIDHSLSDPRHILDEHQRAEVHAALAAVLARVAACLDAAPLRPGDTRLRTQALWAAVHGAGHFEKRGNASVIERELIDTLLAGWGAPAE